MNSKGQIRLSMGLIIRILAVFIITASLPFLAVNPTSPIAQGFFAFGSFLLVIGGNVT